LSSSGYSHESAIGGGLPTDGTPNPASSGVPSENRVARVGLRQVRGESSQAATDLRPFGSS